MTHCNYYYLQICKVLWNRPLIFNRFTLFLSFYEHRLSFSSWGLFSPVSFFPFNSDCSKQSKEKNPLITFIFLLRNLLFAAGCNFSFGSNPVKNQSILKRLSVLQLHYLHNNWHLFGWLIKSFKDIPVFNSSIMIFSIQHAFSDACCVF